MRDIETLFKIVHQLINEVRGLFCRAKQEVLQLILLLQLIDSTVKLA